MADKTAQLLLDALGRAAADPGGLPLHSSRKTPGLFTATTQGRELARRCKDEGLLHVLRTETAGRSSHEICGITEKGLALLLDQVSPRQALEQLVTTLQARQIHVAALVQAARNWEAGLDSLQTVVQRVLQQLQKPAVAVAVSAVQTSSNGTTTWPVHALDFLAHWQAERPTEDCSLPALFREAAAHDPKLSIGSFHDGLRALFDQETIYLHPWTGPLYEIPEPAYALLVGHEIAFYASIRSCHDRKSA